MNRIDRALKRRDRETGRVPSHESLAEPLLEALPGDEPQVIPAGLLDRFPYEPHRPDAVRQPPAADAMVSERFVESSSAIGSEPPRAVGVFRGFNATIRGKVVGSAKMNRRSAEQYRRLAAALHQVQVERGIRKVMVTSAVAGEGKTLTALNLALTLGESYRRQVVLIDADLRCPRLPELLDVTNTTGLNEVLKETHPSTLTLTTVSPRLSVLPAGHADPDPTDLLTSRRMASVLDELSAKFDWVVVDTPPVALLPDANLLAGMVDVAVLVVLAGRTSCDLVDRAIQALGRQRILGIILNRADTTEGQYPTSDYGDRYRLLSR